MKKIVLITVLVLLTALFLSADIYVKSMQRTGAFEIMGKPSQQKVEIREMWMGKNRFVQHSEEVSILVNYETQKIAIFIHPQKIYFEISTDIDREKLLAMVPPKVAEVIKSIKVTDVKVTLDGPKRKIANWNCEGSEMEMIFQIPALSIMPKFKMKMWYTKDVTFDYKAYTQGAEEFFGKYIMGLLAIDDASLKELEKMEKMDGFQIATDIVIDIFGTEIKVESQSLEVAEKPAPTGTYDAPKGYKKQKIDLPLGLPSGLI
jgi:hypothetical protein